MKAIVTIAILAATILLTACDTVTTTDSTGKVTTTRTVDQQAVNSLAGTLASVAITAAANRLGLPQTSPVVSTAASNALNGVAAQAQANVGASPVAANVAQGAGTQAIGSAVQSALPAAPINQQTVNAIFTAAQLVK